MYIKSYQYQLKIQIQKNLAEKEIFKNLQFIFRSMLNLRKRVQIFDQSILTFRKSSFHSTVYTVFTSVTMK